MAEQEGKAALPPLLASFRWDLNAACNYEEATGKLVEKIDVHSNRELRTLLFAGIRDQKVPGDEAGKTHGEAGVTERDVGILINNKNVVAVVEMIREQLAFQKAKAKNR